MSHTRPLLGLGREGFFPLPRDAALTQALSRCTSALMGNRDVIYFSEPSAGNQVFLESEHGRVILDLHADGRVGAVELTFYTGPEKRELAWYKRHRPSKRPWRRRN